MRKALHTHLTYRSGQLSNFLLSSRFNELAGKLSVRAGDFKGLKDTLALQIHLSSWRRKGKTSLPKFSNATLLVTQKTPAPEKGRKESQEVPLSLGYMRFYPM